MNGINFITPGAQRHRARRTRWPLILAVLALVFPGLWYYASHAHRILKQKRGHYALVLPRVSELRAMEHELVQVRKEKEQLRLFMETLRHKIDRRDRVTRILDEVIVSIPEHLTLEKISIEKDRVILEGCAGEHQRTVVQDLVNSCLTKSWGVHADLALVSSQKDLRFTITSVLRNKGAHGHY